MFWIWFDLKNRYLRNSLNNLKIQMEFMKYELLQLLKASAFYVFSMMEI